MRYEKSCGAVVYKIENGIQLYLSIKSKRDGHWGFAKGHVEQGETELETATREVLEETNIKVNILEGFRVTKEYAPNENIHKMVVFFIGNSENYTVKIQEEEVEDFKISTYKDIYQLLTYESDKDVLKKANEYLLKLDI
ncbi:bis(5'-nucleosyl)-tetraphosphatase [Clostridium akagii]|uniref:bis(5'-nucleosyl)-tetraphosphatase n=1 Tax=Clostridium akagii TaxID=91623 RepID=UPI00047BFC85|nr:NUDIX domain-containing protein [Clostridium akagii]